MSSSKPIKNHLRDLVVLTLVVFGFSALCFQVICPQYYFSGLLAIPMFFLVYGIFYILGTLKVQETFPNGLLWVTLLLRAGKFILAMASILICAKVAREWMVSFTITLGIYYLVYLVYDTWFFYQIEGKHTYLK